MLNLIHGDDTLGFYGVGGVVHGRIFFWRPRILGVPSADECVASAGALDEA